MEKRYSALLSKIGKVETVSKQCRSLEQKLNCAAAELAGKSDGNPAMLNKKIDRVAAALAKTTRQLNYMAEEFTPQQATSSRYQAA